MPITLHLTSVVVFAVLGAFQFSTRLRRPRSGWHRAAGRLLAPIGLVAALSALALTLLSPGTEGGDLLYAFRLLAGSAMAACLVLGYLAIRRRDLARHKAWMVRAYAIGLGAGTQVFTLAVGEPIWDDGDRTIALLQAAGWGINLGAAEWIIRRRPVLRAQSVEVLSR